MLLQSIISCPHCGFVKPATKKRGWPGGAGQAQRSNAQGRRQDQAATMLDNEFSSENMILLHPGTVAGFPEDQPAIGASQCETRNPSRTFR
jgi:hypothetical protein